MRPFGSPDNCPQLEGRVVKFWRRAQRSLPGWSRSPRPRVRGTPSWRSKGEQRLPYLAPKSRLIPSERFEYAIVDIGDAHKRLATSNPTSGRRALVSRFGQLGAAVAAAGRLAAGHHCR